MNTYSDMCFLMSEAFCDLGYRDKSIGKFPMETFSDCSSVLEYIDRILPADISMDIVSGHHGQSVLGTHMAAITRQCQRIQMGWNPHISRSHLTDHNASSFVFQLSFQYISKEEYTHESLKGWSIS